jgi:hypothetical protein
MFVVTEDEAAAIRAAFEQGGAFAAAIELRRHFSGITDNAQARDCAQTIAGWKPAGPAASPTRTASTMGVERAPAARVSVESGSAHPSPMPLASERGTPGGEEWSTTPAAPTPTLASG